MRPPSNSTPRCAGRRPRWVRRTTILRIASLVLLGICGAQHLVRGRQGQRTAAALLPASMGPGRGHPQPPVQRHRGGRGRSHGGVDAWHTAADAHPEAKPSGFNSPKPSGWADRLVATASRQSSEQQEELFGKRQSFYSEEVLAEERALSNVMKHGCCWGSALLAGVDAYAIEMPHRKGLVPLQGDIFGISVANVTAVTPDTTESQWNDRIKEQVSFCANAAEHWSRAGRFGAEQVTRPYALTPKQVACVVSHIKALRVACEAKAAGSNSTAAIVFEDDAGFAALEYWPDTLVNMLASLPATWQVVNAALSNPNRYSVEHFGSGDYFREYGGNEDWSNVAVVYNLRNPKLCDRVSHFREWNLITKSDFRCQPSDLFGYKELGMAKGTTHRKHQASKFQTQGGFTQANRPGQHSYVATMPLVYFSTFAVEVAGKLGNSGVSRHNKAFAREQRQQMKHLADVMGNDWSKPQACAENLCEASRAKRKKFFEQVAAATHVAAVTASNQRLS